MNDGLVYVEVRDATGYVRSTTDSSVEAAKDWLWRTLLDCKTDAPARGPATVRITVVR